MLTVSGNQFMLDSKPFRIISGAMHYFRVMPEFWRDRMKKMRACGLNTLETYTAWNLHEPEEGQFDFSGILDIEKYIKIAQEEGLHVILRPGPYICAEWEAGGFPYWLIRKPGIKFRVMNEPYVNAVESYYKALLKRLAHLQYPVGPIVAVQIENEYGSFCSDKDYLAKIEAVTKECGFDKCLLFTSDGPSDRFLQGGTLPHIFKTVNFGSHPAGAFEKLKEYQPEGPLMCMEFWNGWFDHWTKSHITRDADDAAKTLDEMLAAGASVNFYMFHGGTNFGFMSGANANSPNDYHPTVTSYDYDSPVNEYGDLTPKYFKYRDVIKKYAPVPDGEPENAHPIKKSYGELKITAAAKLFDVLPQISKEHQSILPEYMEAYGQDHGFILYRTRVQGPRKDGHEFRIYGIHDRAMIFANGKHLDTIYRNEPERTVRFDISAEGATLDILVENMGRINYGPYVCDPKGINGAASGLQLLKDWTVYTMPMKDISKIKYGAADFIKGPAFYKTEINIDEPAETFLSLPGWTKGVCWVNGFNLGRYWSAGPQKTLYIPSPLLKKGKNEIVIFELHKCERLSVYLTDRHDIG